MNDAMNNAIRMVVTNSLLNIVLKFPLCIIPLLNLGYTFMLDRTAHGYAGFHTFIWSYYDYMFRIYLIDAFVIENRIGLL